MARDKSVVLNILGNNDSAKAKLDEIDRKADALKNEHPELTIGIDDAAAKEKLAILRAEIRKTKADAGVHSRGAVKWCQAIAGSGGSQGFPAMALLMASSAVMPWAAAVSR
jgi:hypothetical protein